MRQQIDPTDLALFQRRVWRTQHVAWGVMAAFVLAGLFGLLGSGGLGRGSVTAPDGTLQVDYERFLRRGNRTTLVIRVRPAGNAPAPALGLRIDQPYLDGMRVESVFPPPRRAQAGRDHVTLDFDVDPLQPGPLTVTIHLLPERVGARQAAIRAEGGPPVAFRQWVYP